MFFELILRKDVIGKVAHHIARRVEVAHHKLVQSISRPPTADAHRPAALPHQLRKVAPVEEAAKVRLPAIGGVAAHLAVPHVHGEFGAHLSAADHLGDILPVLVRLTVSISPLLCPAGNGTVQRQRTDAVFGPQQPYTIN
ncbi:hypothetical protein TYRP_001603 [Tyrophagus putrescentiae]|nr:hypothetical protein TYRP_001603 [Tyrophagus putrescentiae]